MPTEEEVVQQIVELVNKETKAWDTQDAELLVGIFHHDMVWPWPKTAMSHDPMEWVITWGRYDYKRWKDAWQELFDTHQLVHNKREIKKVEISNERDGAFAVVDIDSLWLSHEGVENHWKGRVCKVYTKVGNDWKFIMQTGVLDYSGIPTP